MANTLNANQWVQVMIDGKLVTMRMYDLDTILEGQAEDSSVENFYLAMSEEGAK